MTGIHVLGTGSYTPPMTADNAAFEKLVDTNDEWIRTRTGIVSRHVSNGEPTWFMGAQAARAALASAGIDASEIGLLLDTTVTPEYFTPSTACIVQREIGAVNAMAFDINAACAGFVTAFDAAARYLETDPYLKYVLVISNENLTKLIDYEDRSSCILFGDGAAACVVSRPTEKKRYASYFLADGTGADALYARAYPPQNAFMTGEGDVEDHIPKTNSHYLQQDGRAVYRFATDAMPKSVRVAAERADIALSDIDVLIPHQANLRIIETAAKKLDFPMEKIVINLQQHGNTSSASIPIALDEAVREGRIHRGDLVCITGFGAGLTMGAVIFEY